MKNAKTLVEKIGLIKLAQSLLTGPGAIVTMTLENESWTLKSGPRESAVSQYWNEIVGKDPEVVADELLIAVYKRATVTARGAVTDPLVTASRRQFVETSIRTLEAAVTG